MQPAEHDLIRLVTAKSANMPLLIRLVTAKSANMPLHGVDATEEQLAFWTALCAPVKLSAAQRRLGEVMRGEV